MKIKISRMIVYLTVVLLFAGCATTKIDEEDVAMPKIQPKTKSTNYTIALKNLGIMTEVYATGELRIQSNPIGDDTGSSGATGGEIPRDITEMIKSALNTIGGAVVYIPYDPAFIQNQITTGYSDFQNKLVPEVVITGGITEFDRGLNTTGDGTSFSASVDVSNAKIAQAGLGSSVGGNYDDIEKSGLSRITLDFNLIDFATMAGVSQMNTVNSIEVHKVMKDKSLGINILGIGFGSKGVVKRVQGRHHAVRTLVEISMIQMIGKYLGLPYWKLLGDGAVPDNTVKKNFLKSYYGWPMQTKIAGMQEWLYINGYDVYVNGELDIKTRTALAKYDSSFKNSINATIAWNLYSNLPIDDKAYNRRLMLLNGAAKPPYEAKKTQKKVSKPQKKVVKQVVQKTTKKTTQPKKRKQVKVIKSKPAVGRILNESEW